MQAAMGKDPVKLMVEGLQLLSDMNEGSEDDDLETRKINALEEITEYCADIDLAKGVKIIIWHYLCPEI